MKYFKNELNVEIINPNSQWVINETGGWFIWYFKIGKNLEYGEPYIKTDIQLFATTIIADKILIINAPVSEESAGENFMKSATLVNELMEALTISFK